MDVRRTRHTPRRWLRDLARVGPRHGRHAGRHRGPPDRADVRGSRSRRQRRRRVPASVQVRAVITNGRDGAAQRSSGEGRDAGPTALAEGLGTRLGPATTFATTEHFNLQTARAPTVSEPNGRASIYLAALSSNLIALAFIGQMSRLGTAFYAFALILLPVLAFVGVVTFLRLVQSSVEDIAYAQRIALVRSYYLRIAPELEPYFVVLRAAPFCGAPGAWQLTLTAAGMVAVVNSVVMTACAGLVLV